MADFRLNFRFVWFFFFTSTPKQTFDNTKIAVLFRSEYEGVEQGRNYAVAGTITENVNERRAYTTETWADDETTSNNVPGIVAIRTPTEFRIGNVR